MRGDAQHRGALGARGAQAANIGVLQVADAAVNHLEAFGRGAAREIPLFDQGDAQAAQGRVPGGRGAERPAADDQQVEFLRGERLEVALHVLKRDTDDRRSATRARRW